MLLVSLLSHLPEKRNYLEAQHQQAPQIRLRGYDLCLAPCLRLSFERIKAEAEDFWESLPERLSSRAR
jgi:hypothetical protein